MYVVKKRLRPELRKDSENITRDKNYKINNVKLTHENEIINNNDYLKFIK